MLPGALLFLLLPSPAPFYSPCKFWIIKAKFIQLLPLLLLLLLYSFFLAVFTFYLLDMQTRINTCIAWWKIKLTIPMLVKSKGLV